GGKKHAPRLFSITPGGQMDAAPLRIAGVRALNDLESISGGPGGSVFVCTSHSINRHGHRHESRRRLLQLAIEPGRKAHILGQVDLTTAPQPDGSRSLEE